MPRQKEAPNHGDLYEVKMTLGKMPDGSLDRRSFYSPVSKEEARKIGLEAKAQWIASQMMGIGKTNRVIPFNNWCNKYIEKYKEGKISDSTLSGMKYRCEKYIKPYFKDCQVSSIRPIDIQSFFDSTEIKDKSSAVKSKLRFFLNSLFVAAVDNDICFKNPVKNIVLPSYEKVIVKHVYTAEQQRMILDYIKAHDCRKEIAILLKTGIRRGELLALEWKDIDLEKQILTINKAVKDTPGAPFIGSPKTKAGIRMIPFDKELKEIIESMPRIVKFTRRNSEGKKEKFEITPDLVVPGKYSELLSPHNWHRRMYLPLLSKISAFYQEQGIVVPILSPHEMRHSFGTTLYDNGVDLRTIQKIMGHANLDITSNLYVHDNIETMRKALKYDQ